MVVGCFSIFVFLSPSERLGLEIDQKELELTFYESRK